jgi:sugar phosphate isomerase/epimerase
MLGVMLPLEGNFKHLMGPYLATAKASGFDFVELRMDAGEFVIVDRKPVLDVEDLRRQLADHDLRATVHSCWGVNLADDAMRPAWETCVLGTLEVSRDIGASRVVVHPGTLPASTRPDARARALAAQLASFRKIGERAADCGLTVVVENLNPTPDVVAGMRFNPYVEPRNVVALIHEIGLPHVQMVFDVGHYCLAVTNGYAMDFVGEDAQGLIAHVHIHDNLGQVAASEPRYEEALQIGLGDLHLPVGFGLVPGLIEARRVPGIGTASVTYELMDARYWRDLAAQRTRLSAIVERWREVPTGS